MAIQRATPVSEYFSGQGRLIIGDRDPTTGIGFNFLEVGNVPALSIDIATTKFEHKESMSGNRGKDISNYKEKNGTAKFTLESWSKVNLAMSLHGIALSNTTATVLAEPHIYKLANPIVPLKYPKVSVVVVKKGATTIASTEYTVDLDFGTIRFNTTVAGLADGDAITVGYTVGAYESVDALSLPNVVEKVFRFEGINTIDGKLVVVDIPRFSVDPLSTLPLINDELGSYDVVGNILQDPTITSGSQYFTVRKFLAAP